MIVPNSTNDKVIQVSGPMALYPLVKDDDGHGSQFSNPIATFYDTHFVPLVFAPYANDLATRVSALRPKRVLEIACGTGAVTRRLREALPVETEIVASDLNPAMLGRAISAGTAAGVTWALADATALPFDTASFDAVVCQFGIMFFPDRVRALKEARRVLRPGGTLLFNTWDRLEENELPQLVVDTLVERFPDDPPGRMIRQAYAHHDLAIITADLAAAGFVAPVLESISLRATAPSARDVAFAYCLGGRLRLELDALGVGCAEETARTVETAVTRRFGEGSIDARMKAYVATVRAPA